MCVLKNLVKSSMNRINSIEDIKCFNIENCDPSYMLQCAVEFGTIQLSYSWLFFIICFPRVSVCVCVYFVRTIVTRLANMM